MMPEPANNHSDSTDDSDDHRLDIRAERALEQIAAILAEIAVGINSNDHNPDARPGEECTSNAEDS